jgi:hypothetical protein
MLDEAKWAFGLIYRARTLLATNTIGHHFLKANNFLGKCKTTIL